MDLFNTNFYSTSRVPHIYPTHFNFSDLDLWVHAAYGTQEYNERCILAQQIVDFDRSGFSGLELQGGNLTSLPKAIGSLSNLQELKICKNSLISSLPEEIGNLYNLKTFFLEDLPIDSLPSKIGKLPLRKLIINNTSLRFLPPEIGQCSDLEELHILNSEMTIIPNEIEKLQRLKLIRLASNNKLFYLPESIGNLKNLEVLDLERSYFSYLPQEIFSMKKLRYLNIQGCPFSANALERLQPYINSSLTIAYSQENVRIGKRIERSLNELFKELYHLAGLKKFPLFNALYTHPNIESLRSFLDKFSYTLDFQRKDPQNSARAKKFVEFLLLAEKDNLYRERFFAALKSGDSINGDQISLIFIFLSLEKKLSQINHIHLPNLAKLLLGGFKIRSILHIVRERVKDLAIYDSIQISLGYLSKLKKWHDLPLDEEDMGFFNISEIPPSKLHTASLQIDRMEEDRTKQADYLVSHELWLDALKLLYPTQYAEKGGNPKALIEWTRDLISQYLSI